MRYWVNNVAIKKYYNIYSFSLSRMLSFGKMKGDAGELFLDDASTIASLSDIADPVDVKPNCMMFQQALEILGDSEEENAISTASNRLREVFITVDFSDSVKTKAYSEKFHRIDKFTLSFDGKPISFVKFLKSNSMTHDSKMYFVNETYHKELMTRLTFDLVKDGNEVLLPKWYAYTGLVCSQVLSLDNIKFNYGELVVVKDKKFFKDIEAITAVSVESLKNEVKDYKEAYEKLLKAKDERDTELLKNRILSIEKQWSAYLNSSDYLDLKNRIDRGDEHLLAGYCDIYSCLSCIEQAFSRQNDVRVKFLVGQFLGEEPALKAVNNSNHKAGDKNIVIPWMKVRVKDYPHEVNAFDGEGLISYEFADEIDREMNGLDFYDQIIESIGANSPNRKKARSHSYQIRLPYIKGVVHAGDIQQFFADHGVTKIKGIVNFTAKGDECYEEFPVENVKMILTESQVKMIKFASNISHNNHLKWYMDQLEKYNFHLSINNCEPDQSKEGKLNYEFVSTLPLGNKLIKELVKEDYEKVERSLADDEMRSLLSEGQKEVFDIAPDFIKKQDFFKNKRDSRFATLKASALQNKIHIDSCRKFLATDLMDLLYHIIGVDDPTDPVKQVLLQSHEVYLPNTDFIADFDKVVILRNPHYSRNEIATATKVSTGEIRDKYFGKLTGVIWVSPSMCTAERLGGADYDGDTVLVINDRRIVSRIKDKIERRIEIVGQDSNIEKKTVNKNPIALIPSLEPASYHFGSRDIALCLKETFSSNTGKISNDAFKYSEFAYLYENNNPLIKESVYDFVCFFTVLGGLEIDSAKSGRKPRLPKVDEIIEFATGESFETDLEDFVSSKYIGLKDKIKETSAGEGYLKDITNIDSLNEKNELSVVLSELVEGKTNDSFAVKTVVKNASVWEVPPFKRPKFTEAAGQPLLAGQTNFFECYLIRKRLYDQIIKIKDHQDDNDRRLVLTKAMIQKAGVYPDYISDDNFEKMISLTKTDLPKEEVEKYCRNVVKYHYLEKHEDKGDYLDSLSISGFGIDYLFTDFVNGGNRVLFLCLLYNMYAKEYGHIDMYDPYDLDDVFTDESIENTFLDIIANNKELHDAVFNSANEYMEKWASSHFKGVKGCTQLKDELDWSLRKDYGNKSSFDDINSVLKNCKDKDITYDVYCDSVKEFVKRG